MRVYLLTAGKKRCGTCGEAKFVTEFSRRGLNSDRLRSSCKDCVRVYERDRMRRRYHNGYRDVMLQSNRRVKLLKQYGLTEADFDAMMVAQEGRCAICGSTETKAKNKKRLTIDHCHKTGVVRGLVCHNCNVGLGTFGDDISVLRAAVAYLAKTQGDG